MKMKIATTIELERTFFVCQVAMAGLHAANKLLLAAAADGNLDEVQRLVKLDGASANSSDPSGTTALHAAAMTDD